MRMLDIIKKNIKALLSSHIFSKLLFLIQFVFLSRTYGFEGLGRYAFIFSISYVIVTFFGAGINNLIIRDVSKNKCNARKLFSTANGIRNIICLIFISILIIVWKYHILDNKMLINFVLAIIIAYLDGYIQSTFAIFKAHEKMGLEASLEIISNSIIVALVIIACIMNLNFIYVPIIFIFSKFIILIISMSLAFKFRFNGISFNLNQMLNLIWRSTPFLLSGVGIILIFKIDVIMLSFMKGDYETGLYALTYSIIRNAEIIPLSISLSFLPKLTQMYKSNKLNIFLKLQNKLYKFILIFFALIATGSILFKKIIFESLFQINYSTISIIFPIILISSIFIFLVTATGALLISQNKEKIQMKICLLGALINVSLNLLMIPTLSFIGAGIATLSTYAIMFGLQYHSTKI